MHFFSAKIEVSMEHFQINQEPCIQNQEQIFRGYLPYNFDALLPSFNKNDKNQ